LKETVILYSTKQSSSFNGKQSQPELTVICAISGKWHKATAQPSCLIPVPWNSHKRWKQLY